MNIRVTATVSFDYDPEDGIATTPDEAIANTARVVSELNYSDFDYHYVIEDN